MKKEKPQTEGFSGENGPKHHESLSQLFHTQQELRDGGVLQFNSTQLSVYQVHIAETTLLCNKSNLYECSVFIETVIQLCIVLH